MHCPKIEVQLEYFLTINGLCIDLGGDPYLFVKLFFH